MSSEDNEIDRRTFLKTTAAGGALVGCAGLGLGGCGNGITAAPREEVLATNTLPLATINEANGLIRLQVPTYVDLDKVGGAITLGLHLDPNDQNRGYALPPDQTFLVVQFAAGEFAAFQSSCPHAGCALGYSSKNMLIECPCHSSRFLVTRAQLGPNSCAGDVAHLPARSPLQTWTTSYDSATKLLTIDLMHPIACPPLPNVVNNVLRLPFADFPNLTMVGGSAWGFANGVTDPVIVIRVTTDMAVALDAKCTHRGCVVAFNGGTELQCPCHGSKFGFDGHVMSPPATTPLTSYRATIEADAISVLIV